MEEADRIRVLLEVYKSYLGDLGGFRDTIFKVISVLVGILLAFVAGVVQFKQVYLILLVPIPIALLIVAVVGYSAWRWELIQVAANIEKAIGPAYLPRDCCFESIFVEKHKRGGTVPGGLDRRSVAITVLLIGVALAIFYYFTIPSIPTLKSWLESFK